MISVIVPARDEAAGLGRCLEALLAQEGLSAPWEIIVVDDGSTDGTAEIARGFATDTANPAVRVIRGPRPGHAAAGARNAGAVAARGDVLLFTDADCRPEPGWAAALVTAVAAPGVAAAMGVQRTTQTALVARLVQAELDEKQARLLARGRVTFADTATCAYRADVFRALGGFDPALRHFEDTDLAFRTARGGHDLVVVPGAVVDHRHAADPLAYAERKARFGYWGALVYRRHPDRVADDSRTPASMRAQLAIVGWTAAALVAAPFWPPARGVALAGVVAFVAACLPFLPHARRHGWDAVAWAPAFLLVRAVALAAGLGVGTVALAMGGHGGRWDAPSGTACNRSNGPSPPDPLSRYAGEGGPALADPRTSDDESLH